MKDYSTALLWSRVFLMGKSFTSFSGSEVAMALLFPMETLFESYIAALLKKKLGYADFAVSAQDKTYHLFDEPGKKFLMRPDIVVKRKYSSSIPSGRFLQTASRTTEFPKQICTRCTLIRKSMVQIM